MFKILAICAIGLLFAPLIAQERPYTFSPKQEQTLAQHPNVLSFLYHMTRNRLTFEEMAVKYRLASTPQYHAFLLEHGLISPLEDGQFAFSFLNPNGTWRLRDEGSLKDGVLCALREKGVDQIKAAIGQKPVNVDDETSSVWITNTYRLTPEQYQNYKQELLQLAKKYTDLGEQNLFSGTEHRVIWVVQLADCVDPETAQNSHLLFGPVEEF
jgi:hypothetical protein